MTEEVTEDFSRADRGAGSLLERDRELTELDELLADARESRGRLALIEGPAGIGKTQLLEEARERAGRRGLTVLTARGGELERDFGFGIVRQLLEPALARANPRQRGELTAGAARLAGPVFATEPGRADDDGDPTHGVLHGLYWLVANLGEQAPVLLTIDDVHWADRPSLRFLIHLARRLDGLPVAIALASRTSEEAGEPELLGTLVLEAHPPILRPVPLSEAAVETVVKATVGEDAGPALCLACREATGGSPFLLTELLAELRRESPATGEINPALVRTLAPTRISAAVLLRIGRLDRTAPALARAVAVLGTETGTTQAAELAGLEPADARSVASALAGAGVLERGEPLRFVHPIVRTAVYEDIPEGERGALHRDAAVVLASGRTEPEAIAVHLLASAPAGEPEVVAQLRAAADAALARGAPETAVRYLRRARAEPPATELRPPLELELGSAAERAGDPDALELLREAFALAPEPESRAAAAIELGLAAFGRGRIDETVDAFERGLEAAGDAGTVPAHRLEALLLFIGVSAPRPRRRLRERLDSAHERAPELPGRVARPLLASLCVDRAYSGATAAEAAELAERALGGGRLLREQTAHSTLIYPPAWVLIYTDRLGAAERVLGEAFADASARGSVNGLVLASGVRSAARYWRGDLAGAESDARASLELAAEAGLTQYFPMPLATLVCVLVEQGGHEEAEAALDELGPPSEDPDAPPGGAALRESRARLLYARRAFEPALAELTAIQRWEEEYGATSGVVQVRWRAAAALLNRALGNLPEALRLAREQVDLARHFGAPIAIGVGLRAQGLVEGGETGIDRLREAVAELEHSDARLEHARALVDLGSAVRRAGSLADARERLAQGMDLAHRCGATALVDAASEELRLAGARPRRAALTGLEALTPGERRVAEMAAEGMANKEIAQALFVTLRTVEMHLSNAYGKLEIHSRRELSRALESQR